jgi:putative ABC transport system permease protein
VLRAHLLPADLLTANAVTLATALLAGLYPAWNAARLDPVQALRNE